MPGRNDPGREPREEPDRLDFFRELEAAAPLVPGVSELVSAAPGEGSELVEANEFAGNGELVCATVFVEAIEFVITVAGSEFVGASELVCPSEFVAGITG